MVFLPDDPFYWLIDKIKDLGLEYFNRFYAKYPGKVEKNSDPQQQGRVKVSVFSLGNNYSLGSTTKAKPLELYAYPTTPYGGPNYGFYFPPEPQDNVWVWFDHGNPTQPHISGGWWGNSGSAPAGKFKSGTLSEIPAEFNTLQNATLNNGPVIAQTPPSKDPLAPEMTTRGIKSKGGHGFLMEDDKVVVHGTTEFGRENRIELWTGKNSSNTSTTPTPMSPAQKHHQFIMSDALSSITIKSYKGHSTVFDDSPTTPGIRTTSTYGHQLFLNDNTKDILIKTPLNQMVMMSDTSQSILVSTPGMSTYSAIGPTNITSGSIITISAGGAVLIQAQGIGIESTSAAPCFTKAAGIVTNTFLGAVTETFVGGLTQNITGAATIGVQGTLTVAPTICNILSNSINLGTQQTKYFLVDERFITQYNNHSHSGHGAPPSPQITVISNVATSETRAS